MSANKKAQIWDYVKLEVVKTLPDVPGSATLLPLNYTNNYTAEILFCGGSYEMKPENVADATCARINLGNDNPTWEIEDFGNPAQPRVMTDAILMSDGKVLYLNGAVNGYAAWDGTVFVSGSNPNSPSCFSCEYPTEYRVERFTPPHLLTGAPRATMKSVAGSTSMNGLAAITVNYNQVVTVVIAIRMVTLKVESVIPMSTGYAIDVVMPPNSNIMPNGAPADTAVEINLKQ
ncbi:8798_t:CDS:2 [Dentiscutata erythropus]|uniref:8798_t:CDS:1 n=1 Tax=Dentiscutata erythropus TaxID=1348616 RepID=A0A9N9D3R1_9GLOM|nr:8798_t:CDS:2 [Dentiscutata erythropus]